ncbi:MAG: hypothetical protein AABX05_05535 [Nanoarchaeota archaeon]|mgnify:CR=1 FL=1
MIFWKKAAAKKVREDLRYLEKRTRQLREFSDKADELRKRLQEIRASLEKVKAEVIERYEEEKIKPWIDPQFDVQISALAGEEIAAIENLEHNIDGYLELAGDLKSVSELDELITLLQEEELQIEAREKQNEQIIIRMEAETLAGRLSARSEDPPAQKTKDGVSWKKIVLVSRELGGRLECGRGRHSCSLLFPKGNRPVPLSSDVSTTALAEKIREQLLYSLPKHKIPNATLLRNALKQGDLRRAA